jgi:alpha-beta hydrolase superfamily lysophospholipase
MTTHHEEGALTRRLGPGPTLYSSFTSPDGAPTHAGQARAVVALLHGYADYGARYQRVADLWADMGIATATIDLRGHGRSEGPRGYCDRFSDYLDDVGELVRLVGDKAPGVPAVLFGHSFGGLVASSYVIERPAQAGSGLPGIAWKALALTGPFFGLPREVPAVQVFAGRILRRIAPGFAMPMGLKGEQMTHDAAIAAQYDKDPLGFTKAPVQWFFETQAAQKRALERAGEVRLPLCIVMGSEDRVAKIASAKEFYERAGSKDKTWDLSQGHLHEVLNEPEWKGIAEKLGKWILAHV